MPKSVVIADSAPIISLYSVNELSLLQKLYGTVFIPKAVFEELTNPKYPEQAQAVKAASYIQIKEIKAEDKDKILAFMESNIPKLDKGESEVLVLARELKADLLIIDERKARNVAALLRYTVIGAVGIILRSYENGFLDEDDIFQIVDIWKTKDTRGLGILLENEFEKLQANRGFEP